MNDSFLVGVLAGVLISNTIWVACLIFNKIIIHR